MRKILLHNVGYFRGMNGSAKDALMHWPRLFYCPHDVQRAAMDELGAIIDRERPDVAAIIEVNRGSVDNGYLDQTVVIGKRFHGGKTVEKYDPETGHSAWWFLAGKSNALFSNLPATLEHFYLSYGTKRLVLVARLEEFTLYAVHLATVKPSVRARQLAELAKRIAATPGPVIVCGDFNVFGGMAELEPLMALGLHPTSTEPTFTASYPHFPIDLFLVSRDLRDRVRTRVLSDVAYSDHLPVILEVDD